MDQLKSVGDSLLKNELVLWCVLADRILFNVLKAVFHKFYLVHF